MRRHLLLLRRRRRRSRAARTKLRELSKKALEAVLRRRRRYRRRRITAHLLLPCLIRFSRRLSHLLPLPLPALVLERGKEVAEEGARVGAVHDGRCVREENLHRRKPPAVVGEPRRPPPPAAAVHGIPDPVEDLDAAPAKEAVQHLNVEVVRAEAVGGVLPVHDVHHRDGARLRPVLEQVHAQFRLAADHAPHESVILAKVNLWK
mmetsp:Transcript_18976/g.61865  ORF Transcript_18976/g.61865 Transcript_18976/m.61865 type:complete len:205 (+) Transcript_18976:501-1115(+)